MRRTGKPNHEGFTLVELVVSAAILGLVSIIAMGLMTTGARTYTSVGNILRLQYEAQIAMTQIQDAVLDCNAGIVWDGQTLAVLNTDTDNPDQDELCLFRYDSTEDCIYYGSNSPKAAALVSDDLLAEHVTAFAVTFENSVAAGRVKTANVTITMERQGKSYTGTQAIALRNEPLTAADLSGLLTAVYP